MSEEKLTPEQMLDITLAPRGRDWMDPSVSFRKGTYRYAAPLKHQKYLGLPNQSEWNPADADWKLPENWKEIILEGMASFLKRHRSFGSFSTSVCAAAPAPTSATTSSAPGTRRTCLCCAPSSCGPSTARYFTTGGKLFGQLAGARDLTEDVLKEWFYYFFQCSECRRCSVYLSLRHRYVRDHHDGERAPQPRGPQHPVGRGARLQLLQDREPPRYPAARLQADLRVRPRRTERPHGHHHRCAHQQEGRGGPLCGAVRRLLRDAPLVHVPRLPDALPRDRARLHLEHLSRPRAATSASSTRQSWPSVSTPRSTRRPSGSASNGSSAASAATCGGCSTSTWTPSTARPIFSKCRSRRSPARGSSMRGRPRWSTSASLPPT